MQIGKGVALQFRLDGDLVLVDCKAKSRRGLRPHWVGNARRHHRIARALQAKAEAQHVAAVSDRACGTQSAPSNRARYRDRQPVVFHARGEDLDGGLELVERLAQQVPKDLEFIR